MPMDATACGQADNTRAKLVIGGPGLDGLAQSRHTQQQRHCSGGAAEQHSEGDELNDRSPAHRGRDYSTRRRGCRGSDGRWKLLQQAGFSEGRNG